MHSVFNYNKTQHVTSLLAVITCGAGGGRGEGERERETERQRQRDRDGDRETQRENEFESEMLIAYRPQAPIQVNIKFKICTYAH